MPGLRERFSAGVSSFLSPGSQESILFSQLTPVYADTGRRALMPEWYFQAPYGQPRRVDIQEIRDLAKQPFIHICIKTIVDDFATTPWEIVPKDSKNFNQVHVNELNEFCKRPNQNKETLNDLMRQWAYDVLVVDAGVINKVFDEGSYIENPTEADYKSQKQTYVTKGAHMGDVKSTEEIDISKEADKNLIEKGYKPLKPVGDRTLIEIYCRDGATFLADGDYTGFVHRYFQYSFKLPRRAPAVFDRDEVVYSMMSPRSYSFYGWSPVQSLEDVIRTLKEAVLYSLTGLTERGVPEGIISVLDISNTELERLKDYWKKEVYGKHHKFAVIGRDSKFTSVAVTARDMEMLATQQWFVRLVMAIFNCEIPVLSLHGEAPKAGTIAIIRRERLKAILPLIQLFEYEMNSEILSEFEYDDVEFKFQTYDIDEDQKKRQMDLADVGAGILTINEVRQQNRGMDPVSWGDEPMQLKISSQFTPGFNQEKNIKPTLDEFRKIVAEEIENA